MPNLLEHYKAFVRQHPSLVQNVERLLHWVVWNPERFSGSEYAYELFNAAVGLLGIYNDAILSDYPGQQQEVANWAFWLAAVEQIQTLIELRAIHLEARGKMSRFGPLIGLEVVKCALRLALWRSSKCNLAMEEFSRADQEQQESQQQLRELLEALTRLRQRYDHDPATAPTAEHLQYNAHLAHASAVRAAAVAPHRPPAACAAAAVAATSTAAVGTRHEPQQGREGLSEDQAAQQQQQQQQQQSALSSTGSSKVPLRCSVCGTVQDAGGGSCSRLASDLQQTDTCKVCGRQLQSTADAGSSSSSNNSNSQAVPGLSEITPEEEQDSTTHCATQGARSSGGSSKLQQGWWRRMTAAVRGQPHPASSQPVLPQQQQQHQQQQQQQGVPVAGSAGMLPGSWGPGLRPYPALSPEHSKAESAWQQQHQRPAWSLTAGDDGIGWSVMWAGEFLHIVKPLVYVTMLKRCGLSSWKPWLTMLALDAASGYGLHTGHAIQVRNTASKWPAGSTLFSLALLRSLSSGQWSPGEQQELMVRRVQLLRYLLRSPCYNALTRRLLIKLVAGSRWVPGLSSLAEFAFSMIEGMQSYYTYVES